MNGGKVVEEREGDGREGEGEVGCGLVVGISPTYTNVWTFLSYSETKPLNGEEPKKRWSTVDTKK